MAQRNVWGLWIGVGLIGLGGLFLLSQLLGFNLMRYLWPLFILAAGAAFFVGMISGGRSLGALAVPGSVITTVGLILFFQNLFGIWGTWAYAWALIIAGAGVGLVLFGRWSGVPDLQRAGRVVIGIGLILFFIFGAFFELGAALLGLRSLGGVLWAVALILLGVYLLFGRALFSAAGGPVSRTAVNYSAQPNGEPVPAGSPAQIYPAGTAGPEVYGTETIAGAAGFRKVIFRALGDMTIQQGEREGLEIEASQAHRERIHAQVIGSALEIRYHQDWLDWLNPRFWTFTPIRYTVYVRDLEAVDAAGLGNMVIPRLSAARFTLAHSGTGNVTIHGLAADALAVHQAGLGNVEVDGRVGEQVVELTGTGSYHAGRLDSAQASVRLSGLGSAVVRVSETLDARVSGTGSIDFYGNPRLNQQVSGLGSVRRVG